MVRACCVKGCYRRSNSQPFMNGIRWFNFPSVKKKQGNYVEEVTTRRRLAWIAAINRPEITFDNIPVWKRVCSLHFHEGKPSYEMYTTHPDWIPTLNLGNDIDRKHNNSLKRKKRPAKKRKLCKRKKIKKLEKKKRGSTGSITDMPVEDWIDDVPIVFAEVAETSCDQHKQLNTCSEEGTSRFPSCETKEQPFSRKCLNQMGKVLVEDLEMSDFTKTEIKNEITSDSGEGISSEQEVQSDLEMPTDIVHRGRTYKRQNRKIQVRPAVKHQGVQMEIQKTTRGIQCYIMEESSFCPHAAAHLPDLVTSNSLEDASGTLLQSKLEVDTYENCKRPRYCEDLARSCQSADVHASGSLAKKKGAVNPSVVMDIAGEHYLLQGVKVENCPVEASAAATLSSEQKESRDVHTCDMQTSASINSHGSVYKMYQDSIGNIKTEPLSSDEVGTSLANNEETVHAENSVTYRGNTCACNRTKFGAKNVKQEPITDGEVHQHIKQEPIDDDEISHNIEPESIADGELLQNIKHEPVSDDETFKIIKQEPISDDETFQIIKQEHEDDDGEQVNDDGIFKTDSIGNEFVLNIKQEPC